MPKGSIENRARKQKPVRNRKFPGAPGDGSRTLSQGAKGARSDASPQKNFDRYVALARSAASSGDAVEAENCYQHAEHYFRLMNRTAGDAA